MNLRQTVALASYLEERGGLAKMGVAEMTQATLVFNHTTRPEQFLGHRGMDLFLAWADRNNQVRTWGYTDHPSYRAWQDRQRRDV